MSESLIVPQGSKEEIYRGLIPQIQAVLSGESDRIAKMANISACLKEAFAFWWVGFYRVEVDEEGPVLLLGPFQGPLACTRIRFGKGVCGTAWKRKETIIVPDVNQFPGHIACSSRSRSEIVVPVLDGEEVVAVLDIDSERQENFDEVDRKYLEEIILLLR